MDISRRTFFFLGWGILKGKVLYELTPEIILPKLEIRPQGIWDPLMGVPYHQTNASMGEWLGFSRAPQSTVEEIMDMIRLLEDDRKKGYRF